MIMPDDGRSAGTGGPVCGQQHGRVDLEMMARVVRDIACRDDARDLIGLVHSEQQAAAFRRCGRARLFANGLDQCP